MRVAVIATHAQVQGLAAIAVHEPGRSFERDVTGDDRDGPARPARRRHGGREAGDDDGAVRASRATCSASSRATSPSSAPTSTPWPAKWSTASSAAAASWSPWSPEPTDEAKLAVRCAAYIDAKYPHVDVVVYDGGQERYPLLMSVE